MYDEILDEDERRRAQLDSLGVVGGWTGYTPPQSEPDPFENAPQQEAAQPDWQTDWSTPDPNYSGNTTGTNIGADWTKYFQEQPAAPVPSSGGGRPTFQAPMAAAPMQAPPAPSLGGGGGG